MTPTMIITTVILALFLVLALGLLIKRWYAYGWEWDAMTIVLLIIIALIAMIWFNSVGRPLLELYWQNSTKQLLDQFKLEY